MAGAFDDLVPRSGAAKSTARSSDFFGDLVPVSAGESTTAPADFFADLTPSGQISAGNIDLDSRPVVRNSDGTISTVRSISIGVDGREVLIPTVSDDGRVMSNDEAISQFQKTGRNLGVFDNAGDATAYAKNLHNQQAEQYGLSGVNQFADLTPAHANFSNVSAGSASEPNLVSDFGVPDYRRIADFVPDSPIAAPSVLDMNADALSRTWGGIKQAALDTAAGVADEAGTAWNFLTGLGAAAKAPNPAAAQPLLSSAMQAQDNTPAFLADAQQSNLSDLRAAADLRARQQARMQSLRDGSLPDDIAYYAKQGASNLAPLVAGVGASLAAPEAAPVILPAIFGGTAAADTYAENRAGGEAPDKAASSAARSGVVNAALATVPGHIIATPFANPLLKMGALALGNEAVMAAGAPINMAAEQIAGDADYSPEEYLQATIEAAKTSAVPSLALAPLGLAGNDPSAHRAGQGRRLVDELDASAQSVPATSEDAAIRTGRETAAQAFDAAGASAEPIPESQPTTNQSQTSRYAAEPIRGGSRVLYRGDVPAMQKAIAEAGLPAGFRLMENGKAAGLYFPARERDAVDAALAPLRRPSSGEAASSQPSEIPAESTVTPEAVKIAAEKRVGELASQKRLSKIDRFALDFLRQHADDPSALAEGLGLRLAEPEQSPSLESIQRPNDHQAHDDERATRRDLTGTEQSETSSTLQSRQQAPTSEGIETHELSPEEADSLMPRPTPNATDTREFKQFFTGSKVVDRSGAPIPVYHGTAENFRAFADNTLGASTGHMTAPLGHFFAEDRAKSQRYAEKASQGVPADERVIDAYLSIKNPKQMSLDQFMAVDSQDQARALKTKLQGEGYDGIHLKDAGQWIAFEPNQIKSASENRGTFDTSTPDIYYSKDNGSQFANSERLTPEAIAEHNTGAEKAASDAWGRGAITKLRNRAGLEFVTKQEVLDKGIAGHTKPEQLEGVNGFRDPATGKLYVLSDSAKPTDVAGVVSHEVFHGHAEQFLGSEPFRRLKVAASRLRESDPEIKTAYERVPNDTPTAHRDEEGLAYLAEEAPNHPLSKRLVDEGKLFLNRLGVPLDWLNAHAAAVRKIAALNLRDAAQNGSVRHTPRGNVLYHKAYHGSPHDFDKFSLDKIGTGEGAQAYGHGLYFAGNKEVAEHYKKALSAGRGNGAEDVAKRILDAVGGDRDRAIREAQTRLDRAGRADPQFRSDSSALADALDMLKSDKQIGGALYEVELAPKEHEYLDWDKPLSEQSPHVREALAKVGEAVRGKAYDFLDSRTGSGAYQHISGDAGGEKAASEALHKVGIRGIRYLDGSSRNAGEGHHNYVIFNDKDVQVTAKYSKQAQGAAVAPEKEPETAKLENGSDANTAGLAIRGIARDPKEVRELGRGDIRAALAQKDRAIGKADAAVRAFMKHYDKRPRDVLSDPRKALADVIRFQKDETIPDYKVRPFFAATRQLLDAQATEIRSFGKQYLKHLVEDYFPQQWKDTERAEQFFHDFAGKRPLAGDKRFTKERVFQDYEEGIAAGLEPISNNPVDILMSRYASGEKLLASLRIMKSLEDRGWVRDLGQGERVPRGWARVNDNAFTSKVIPEPIARDLNNYLDPGLNKFAGWRGFRFGQNLILSARLGLSAFHAGMTTLDTIATHADIGWRRAILLGDLKGGLVELARIPGAVVTSPMRGTKLLKQFYGIEHADPDTAAVLDMLTEGGARAKMHPTDYNDSFRKFVRAWDQGDLKAGTIHAVPAAIEATTRLIAHHLVPAQKMIARVMHTKFRLDELADQLGTRKGDYAATIDALHPDTLRQIASEINATIDDRLGQFAYDNLFWNRIMKDALHASVQSVGWNYGTLRLLFGGAADTRKLVKPDRFIAPLDKAGDIRDAKMSRLTDRLSYLITLNAVVGLSGAALQYAMTGEGPRELKDYFFPRTGRKNPDDSDERLAFPSYVKDEWAFAHRPLTTVQHKLHPVFSMLTEIAENKDFYGTEIFDPDASIPAEAQQLMTYLGKSFLPYAVQGAAKNASTGQSATMTVLPFVGITPAPGDIAKTPFQQYVADKYFDTLPRGSRTQEQAERSQRFRDAVMAERTGKAPDTEGFSPSQMKALARASHQELPEYRFSRLGLEQQIRAYEKATPEEREKYSLRQIMFHGLGSKLSHLPPDERQGIRAQLEATVAQP